MGPAEDSREELREKISFLEFQMTVVFYLSISIFAGVAGFLVWVCTWGKGQPLPGIGRRGGRGLQAEGRRWRRPLPRVTRARPVAGTARRC